MILDEMAGFAGAIIASMAAAWRWLMTEAGVELGATGLGAVTLRSMAAILCGTVIGYERERRRHPAGLRTHVLVALASAMFALLSLELIELQTGLGERLRIDPIRLIEAVTSGVAFLAAGLIIVDRGRVRGLTTGAGMWLAGAIGLACGLGYLQIAAIGTVLALLVLWLMRGLEAVMPKKSGRYGSRANENEEDDAD